MTLPAWKNMMQTVNKNTTQNYICEKNNSMRNEKTKNICTVWKWSTNTAMYSQKKEKKTIELLKLMPRSAQNIT